MSQMCRHYNTTTNGMQTRITRVFCKCLNVDNQPLATVYGACAGYYLIYEQLSAC